MVEDKAALMKKLGRKQLTLQLASPLAVIPDGLARHGLELSQDKLLLTFTYYTQAERTGITTLLADLGAASIRFNDLATSQSSLEDIFVGLVRSDP